MMERFFPGGIPGRLDTLTALGFFDSLFLGPANKACSVTSCGQRDRLAVHGRGNSVKSVGSPCGLLGTDGFGSNKEE